MSGGSRPHNRFHGRVEPRGQCAHAGCDAPGEYRVPGARRPGFDGPGRYRYMCLDHVREHNARYNYFDGMDAEAIYAAQRPTAGWERETRAFAHVGADAPPKWSDFKDPMDALGARFRAARGRAEARAAGLSDADIAAYATLGLQPDADRRAVRAAYARLLRQYHPDRNGGDRSHEARLQAVVDAYQRIAKSARHRGQ